jgi:arsenate reductase (thioredoxin)
VKKAKNAKPAVRHSTRTSVLFVCVGNACRSPIAEAIARYDAADVIHPSSAGLNPLGSVPEMTKQALVRNGYSANDLTSDPLTHDACDAADIIINMTGSPWGEDFSAHAKVEDWIVEDPYGADSDTYQRVLESIKRRVNQLAVGLREKRQYRMSAE